MLKQMQRRFILAAMAAFGTVMLALVAGINLVNYYQATGQEDRLAERLLGYERRAPRRPEDPFPPVDDMPGKNPEAEFMTRFFAVFCDSSGDMQVISRDHISSVDDGEAKEYTQAVLQNGKERGYYGDYRYLVSSDASGSTVLFLNASGTLRYMRTLLFASVGTGLASLAVVFVLVVWFSKYAIRPYVKNIERQKRFITDAGHELKTPITSIATSADIAAMEHEGDEWIAGIQKQTARLSTLVADLVALSRFDEELPFPEKIEFSFSDAAWETAEPFAVRARATGKSYRQEIAEGLSFCGDPDAIRRLLSILLDNAIRYSDEAGGICLTVGRRRGRIRIEVRNSCRLPEELDPDRLFDRFYRPDESRSGSTGGTGIGLSMAQAIAEAHGGRIGVKCQGRTEICFWVIL